ncbi:hypothetical protein AGMMS50229_07380 [Campylobacterota bacterium]|nr:hypothetical protein AGMMS50229_07380 [Campylobacterota bacterium]
MLKKIIAAITLRRALVFALIVLFSALLVMGLGVKTRYVFYMMILLALARHNIVISWIVLVVSIPVILYCAVGLEFGQIDIGKIESFFETNPTESYEFLEALPAKSYLLVAALLALLPLSLFEINKRATGNGQRATGNGQRATGNGQRATGNGQRAK